jgi:hypothetical protein
MHLRKAINKHLIIGAFEKLTGELCPQCYAMYISIIKDQNNNKLPLDKAIYGQEEAYEEEIELYKTYGGD